MKCEPDPSEKESRTALQFPSSEKEVEGHSPLRSSSGRNSVLMVQHRLRRFAILYTLRVYKFDFFNLHEGRLARPFVAHHFVISGKEILRGYWTEMKLEQKIHLQYAASRQSKQSHADSVFCNRLFEVLQTLT